MGATSSPNTLGLHANKTRFTVIFVIAALTGGFLGQQLAVFVPISWDVLGLSGFNFIFYLLAVFAGFSALASFVAGTLADAYGRRAVLLAGWIVAISVPVILALAGHPAWVLLGVALLGINQGLVWTVLLLAQLDLADPQWRGFTTGLGVMIGLFGFAFVAGVTGLLVHFNGLLPYPFIIGIGLTTVGLAVSEIGMRDTRMQRPATDHIPTLATLRYTTFSVPALSAASVSGFMTVLNIALAFALLPELLDTSDLPANQLGLILILAVAGWGIAQCLAGDFTDQRGHKWLITAGMGLQVAALVVLALSGDYLHGGVFGGGFLGWGIGATALGVGAALVLPATLALTGAAAPTHWRGRAVGITRMWRWFGFIAGLLIGVFAYAGAGLFVAVWIAAAVSVPVTAILPLLLTQTPTQSDPDSRH